jgi:hypothetical protein
MLHFAPAQVAAALGKAQPWPHLPQFAALVSVFTSQPSLGLPLQSP